MAERTNIQWTDSTWNPIRARNRKTGKVGHYCELVSPGCGNCYASTMQIRFGMPSYKGQSGNLEEVEIFLDEKVLKAPLRWKKPKMVFVCSMTDLFGSWIKKEWLDAIYYMMEQQAHWHTYQVLTKRDFKMRDYLLWRYGEGRIPSRNIWHGVSIEDQRRLDERSMILSQAPSAISFWSVEPLLEDLGNIRGYLEQNVDWVIIGGESGRKARPCDLNWIRSIVEQCKVADVACFVKQLGALPIQRCSQCGNTIGRVLSGFVDSCGPTHALLVKEIQRILDSKGGNPDEWPMDVRIRECPESFVPQRMVG